MADQSAGREKSLETRAKMSEAAKAAWRRRKDLMMTTTQTNADTAIRLYNLCINSGHTWEFCVDAIESAITTAQSQLAGEVLAHFESATTVLSKDHAIVLLRDLFARLGVQVGDESEGQ